MATPGRRRLIAGGIASAAVAGAIGTTVLVAHGSSPAASLQTAAPAQSATATPSPTPATVPHHRLAGAMVIGRVTSVTSSTLTVVDAKGATHTLSVAARTKVTGPSGTEAVTSIPAGELVIVESRSPRSKAASGASTSTSTASSSGSSAAAGDTVAVAIRDTGFKAA